MDPRNNGPAPMAAPADAHAEHSLVQDDSGERPLPPIPAAEDEESMHAGVLPQYGSHAHTTSEPQDDIDPQPRYTPRYSELTDRYNDQADTSPTPQDIPPARHRDYIPASGASSRVVHTSSAQLRRQAPRTNSSGSTSASIVPRWQPDGEVTICPICRTQFSFFVRKHHCRKCGRVVCNSCSPHRITIPYQYIVQPPSEAGMAAARRLTHETPRDGSSEDVDGLGGGERVRLCNPCVPDPNTAPPQTPTIPATNYSHPTRQSPHNRSASAVAPHTLGPYRPTSAFDAAVANFPARRYNGRQASSTVDSPTRTSRASTTTREPTSSFHRASQLMPEPESRSRSNTLGNPREAQLTATQFLSLHNSSPNARPPPNSHQQYYRSLPSDERPLPRPPATVRRIPEEDECWICHRELPSRSLPDSEKLRANHVESCIANAMGGSSPSPAAVPLPSSPVAPRPFVGSSSSSPQLPIAIANTPEARMAAREQAHAAVVLGSTQRPPSPAKRSGVFPYLGTEKDCVDDAECTICLEEFEVGVEMGRLECFCRFHLKCIRDWFEQKPGQCPIHKPLGM